MEKAFKRKDICPKNRKVSFKQKNISSVEEYSRKSYKVNW